MRNQLYFIGVSFLLFSCASQKPVQKTVSKPTVVAKPVEKKEDVAPQKPPVQHQGTYDFYKVNIGNVAKNDNTISHGSIVSAQPVGYKVTKNYFPAVAQNFRQRYIIVHYTALDNEKSLRVLTQQSVSSHYLVNDYNDDEIYQLVDENKRAYHAGVSSWRGIQNLNDTSIGIEIVNTGYTADAKGVKTFYEFPEWQFKKVAALIKDLAQRYDIPATGILAHSDIAPTRKEDPGPKFPWKRLYDEYNVGMWYDDATKMKYLNAIFPEQHLAELNTYGFITRYQTLLGQLGYGITINGMPDKSTLKTVEAFQYHFRPEKCDGVMDAETWAILQALVEKYPSK